MEEKQCINKLRRPGSASAAGTAAAPGLNKETTLMEEDASPDVARENIVKEMMRIFDGLLGCTPKRTGVNLASIKTALKGAAKNDKPKAENGTQRKLEKEIYRLIKGLVELDSPNTGFAVNVLFNNGSYYYNKANVPLSFGIFLGSLVEFLEGHDCLSICPDEMTKMKTLLARG
ncbi:MAG: hypothetical protein PHP95_06500 [Desulfuromonadaceae bacterium]|nr:hypothetical protein [Desulfuromonadaceae bacterium]MDD2848091.1 hypothetical protein [Desulfuromonadaceae bacterium]MDD4132068.1 hypothetical protein [Desulfuromonadaceae bacterium]